MDLARWVEEDASLVEDMMLHPVEMGGGYEIGKDQGVAA